MPPKVLRACACVLAASAPRSLHAKILPACVCMRTHSRLHAARMQNLLHARAVYMLVHAGARVRMHAPPSHARLCMQNAALEHARAPVSTVRPKPLRAPACM
jgi:hypothetical protein